MLLKSLCILSKNVNGITLNFTIFPYILELLSIWIAQWSHASCGHSWPDTPSRFTLPRNTPTSDLLRLFPHMVLSKFYLELITKPPKIDICKITNGYHLHLSWQESFDKKHQSSIKKFKCLWIKKICVFLEDRKFWDSGEISSHLFIQIASFFSNE